MSRNKEYDLKELLDAFLTRYAGLASEIRGHLQYEKDFSGSDTLSEGLKDPFSVAPYGRELLQVCRQLHKLYGTTVRSNDGRSVDTMWVMLAQILHPSNESIRTILKRELRVELAGHVLSGLQAQSGTQFGRFIRGYYDLLFQTPGEVLEATYHDELAALFKDAAQIADKLVADDQRLRETEKSERREAEDPTAGGNGHYLRTLMDHFKISKKSKLEALTRSSLAEVLLVVAMLVILFGTLVVPGEIAAYLDSLVPGLQPQLLLRLYPWIGMVAALTAVWKTRSLTRRISRQSAVRDAFRVLINSDLVSQHQAEVFLVKQFGYKNARAFLKDA